MTNISVSIDVPSTCRSKNHHKPNPNAQRPSKPYTTKNDQHQEKYVAIAGATCPWQIA